MNPEEHKKLLAVAREHWFYKGKRAIVKAWLSGHASRGTPPVLADIGAGAGLLVQELSGQMRTVGIEPYLPVIPKPGEKSPGRMLCGSTLALPLKDAAADFTVCMDVLEHVRDDHQAMAELVRVTRTGGLIILTLPACSWAMSDWDEALGHFRRYDLRDVPALLKDLPVRILEKRLINNLPFVPVVAYRFIRKRFFPPECPRWEDQVPPAFINRLLYRVFVGTALCGNFRWPFGLGILLVLNRV